MSQLHQYHECNTKGRDFVVGDIHGCFHMLEQALAAICFDPERDRLFSVGDLIDRGPLSHLVLEWLDKPWFHAVRGNHEQMLLDYVDGQIDSYMYSINGGQWLISLPGEQQALYRTRIAELPVAITVGTKDGPVGIVHAECRRDNWLQMISEIDDDPYLLQACLWSRTKINDGNTSIVEGVGREVCIRGAHTSQRAGHTGQHHLHRHRRIQPRRGADNLRYRRRQGRHHW